MKKDYNIEFSKGFTLIELLVTVALLGILAGGILMVLDIGGILTKAKLTQTKKFSASIENSLAISQVGKWSFEETSDPSKDTSGYGNNGTWVGGVTNYTPEQCGLGFGRCMSFSGTQENRIEVDNNPSLNPTSTITVSVWFNPTVVTVSGAPAIVKKADASAGYTIELDGVSFKVHFAVCVGSPSCSWQATPLSAKLSVNTWYNAVGTYDGSKIRLFLNGVEVSSTTATGAIGTITGDLWFGNDPSSPLAELREFTGLVDEVSIYKEALTAYQIQNLYAQGLSKRLLSLR